MVAQRGPQDQQGGAPHPPPEELPQLPTTHVIFYFKPRLRQTPHPFMINVCFRSIYLFHIVVDACSLLGQDGSFTPIRRHSMEGVISDVYIVKISETIKD